MSSVKRWVLPKRRTHIETPSSSFNPTPSTSVTTVTVSVSTKSTSDAGVIAGCVVGGVVFLALVILGSLVYLRIRKRRRTPPSSEFINSLKAGVTPILRLDSGAEYTPTLPEKGGGYARSPQNAYYMQQMKCPDDVRMTDMTVPSTQPAPNVEKPLYPQRFSAPPVNETSHRPSASIGSWWGNESEVAANEVRNSPSGADGVLHFAQRFSLDDPSPPLSYHSPSSLHPLRRQPEPEDVIEIE